MEHGDPDDPEELRLDKPTGLWPPRAHLTEETPEPPLLDDSNSAPAFEIDTEGQLRLRKARFARKLITRALPVAGLLAVIAWTLVELGSVKTGRELRHPEATGSAESESSGSTGSAPEIERVEEEEKEAAPVGKSIKLLTKVDLLRVVPPEGTKTVHMNKELLPAGTVTVVNLWATFCTPCKKELPELKAMFEAGHDRWRDKVRFVPLRIDDSADPVHSYQQFAGRMPPTDAFLVDTGVGGGVRPALVAADIIKENAGIPITLVLDCRQSLRYHYAKVLSKTDIDDLALKLDELHKELGGKYCRPKKTPAKKAGPETEETGDVGDAEEVVEAEPAVLPAEVPREPGHEKRSTPHVRGSSDAKCNEDGQCDHKLEDCTCVDCRCTGPDEKCAPRPKGGHICKRSGDDLL